MKSMPKLEDQMYTFCRSTVSKIHLFTESVYSNVRSTIQSPLYRNVWSENTEGRLWQISAPMKIREKVMRQNNCVCGSSFLGSGFGCVKSEEAED